VSGNDERIDILICKCKPSHLQAYWCLIDTNGVYFGWYLLDEFIKYSEFQASFVIKRYIAMIHGRSLLPTNNEILDKISEIECGNCHRKLNFKYYNLRESFEKIIREKGVCIR
jgi:hypothetical protein